MIEQATEFQQDRLELWRKVDDKFNDINRRIKIYPEFHTSFVSRCEDAAYSLTIDPRFLFGIFLARRGLERDLLLGGDYTPI